MDPFDEPFDEAAISNTSSTIHPPEPACSPVTNFETNAVDLSKVAHESTHFFPPPPGDVAVSDSSSMDALKKQIENRTRSLDASFETKTKSIEEEAANYIAAEKEKRKTTLASLSAANKQSQNEKQKTMQSQRGGDNVWKNVGMILDLSKPNVYSKNTERMRSLLVDLAENPVKSA